MQMKSKLYLRIILLINYIMEKNLFVNVEYSLVKHSTSLFSIRKNVTHTKKDKMRVAPGWTDISDPGPVSVLSRSSMNYIKLTLHNPINLLNVVITNSFS